jgi:N-acetylglucosaminyldiphosphoundecaprenol N-acetyl-beta-D-mannosaminyltransferase
MCFTVLGVRINNATQQQAIALVEESISRPKSRAVSVFFVNAHTLNLAASDPSYRHTLNAADFVFADGTGIRWAARLQGVRVLENLVGTDFTPALLQHTADRGYSYFMLGADEKTIAVAAEYARRTFSGWKQVGYHDGYLADETMNSAAIDAINAARPDVLLVGMGNPIQEQWIQQNTPRWLRRLGHEWLWRLYQQPCAKARRYLIGNPLFLARVLRERLVAR